jgi:peptide-methionine (R)-S-oxide reductase
MDKTRRIFLKGASVAALGAAAFAMLPRLRGTDTVAPAHAEGTFEIVKTDDEWRKLLTADQFAVLRQHATERPFTSPLNDEKRKGTFACAGCALPLFASETKYDSGTGWPSFYDPLPNAIGSKEDNTLFVTRTEVHCRRCGGHLGHVFDDGPAPTGKRYCINGVSLAFQPATNT